MVSKCDLCKCRTFDKLHPVTTRSGDTIKVCTRCNNVYTKRKPELNADGEWLRANPPGGRMPDLKPCPWCESVSIVPFQFGSSRLGRLVCMRCETCGACGPEVESINAEAEARAKWNERGET